MIPFSYLPQQFADKDEILSKIGEVVVRGDFTLGEELEKFEAEFSIALSFKAPHVVGVNSGTDALFLALKALNIGAGDEVITSPYSFYATVAAIVHTGARPVFVDIDSDFNINPFAIDVAVTKRTKAIVPVHWAGRPCDMKAITEIAKLFRLKVIEDAAQAFGSRWDATACGMWGSTGAISLHPLKTLNVWGDGGVIVTRDADLAAKIRRMRNHGMSNRDTCLEWGWNSRLDTIQAVVARHVLAKSPQSISARIKNAVYLNNLLADSPLEWEPMPAAARSNYYLYTVRAPRRDELVSYLNACGIEAKIHYPIPLHLQPAAAYLGYKRGDFPIAERLANETISLPAHEYVTPQELEHMADVITEFYDQRAEAAA